ncbi:flagellar biosynthesis anti-sigma factor FlgM [Neobacillus rhizophilus]|uniref:Negative regulator of flagellin synthesis n=1 Tax=Neobacillus rhizophilus TaxID=2833579 RepID=A0A942U5Y0_9BACI|nr:flagellar biosynthesis anti-sigma factor FlgM [Neobacillus rhizophilus]MBS4213026.1 flagellar biosynthesis anti-sigma factor FlgM [Neobacillus rhizophilus]
MKINDFSRLQAYQSYKNQVNKTPQQDVNKKAQVDKVELSPAAQEKISAEREKRIEELKKQIESGTYKVDSKKITEKLLDSWDRGTDQ